MICATSNWVLHAFQSMSALSHKSPEAAKEDLVKVGVRNNNMSIVVLTVLEVYSKFFERQFFSMSILVDSS